MAIERDQIEELLLAPVRGAGAPTLARLEDTLTTGYARALALDAERTRLERRVAEVARGADGDPSERAEQLADLTRRLDRTDGELTHLRSRLETLLERARTLRHGGNLK